MQKYWQLILGAFLITATFAPGFVQTTPSQQVATTPEDCRDYPLPRPVPSVIGEAPVNGTVKQAEDNKSIIQITYNVTRELQDETLTIRIPAGGKLLNHKGVSQTDNNTVQANLSRDSFWIRYAIGPTVALNLSYTNDRNWIIAPTPEHRGSNVALKPAESGFIGLNILYLGEYSVHKTRVGCQTIRVIEPSSATTNADRRLEMLTSVARQFDVGRAYRTVTIFASPKKLESSGLLQETTEGGFVPDHENEIIVDDQPSIHSANNVWIHEYIHTRQFQPQDDDFQWIIEATATYYAARLSLELGLISESKYNAKLMDFAKFDPDTRLANATTEQVAYKWGALVLARLDAALAEHGRTTLFEIYREMNRGGPTLPDYETFESRLKNDGGLNSSRLNETRAIISGSKRPQPNSVYTGSWIEKPWVINHRLPYIIPIRLFRGLVLLAGITLIGCALGSNCEERLRAIPVDLREMIRREKGK